MILKIFFSSFLILCSFNLFATELGQLNSKQLEKLQQQQNPLIIDVRTTEEWIQTGIIPKSHPLQFFDERGNFDEKKWVVDLKKLQENSDQIIILVCRSGSRSAQVGEFLTKKLGMKNIYHLSNGIQQWQKSSHKLVDLSCHSTKTC